MHSLHSIVDETRYLGMTTTVLRRDQDILADRHCFEGGVELKGAGNAGVADFKWTFPDD